MKKVDKVCYFCLDIRHLSLDELVNSWNELTINTKKNFDEVFKQNQEYEEEIKEKELEIESLRAELEEAEEGREANLDAVKLAEI